MKPRNPGPRSDTNLPEALCRKVYDVDEFDITPRVARLLALAKRPHRREASD